MRCRADTRDADFFAAQIFGPPNVAARDDPLDAFVNDGADHHNIGAAERRADHAAAAAAEKLHIAGDQRADAASRSAADQHHFAVDAVFFEQPFVFGDPDSGVDRREGAEADADAVGCGGRLSLA